MKPRRRLIIALIFAGALLTGMVGVGIYGLLQPAKQIPMPTVTTGVATASPVPIARTPLKPLPRTGDAVAYAKAVTPALFSWNTMSALEPEDYESVVTEDAAPTGVETSALVNDLAAYFPTDTQWQQLRDYKTAETVTIQHADIPAAWGQAVASDPTAVRPGTVAVNIAAVRHRTGAWYGTPAVTSDPVTFTVFVTCQPTFDRCHILRLSGLNAPLK
ncbi:hypothetical protein [Lacisediminihabitans sp. H27-G8]|uniref:hypothetical protein n=1 Tax=Lacisediminihabitans sp. H27-G8 TaxID=3111909 RepID=UPI0038FCEF5D